jgi:hypothetical protein
MRPPPSIATRSRLMYPLRCGKGAGKRGGPIRSTNRGAPVTPDLTRPVQSR